MRVQERVAKLRGAASGTHDDGHDGRPERQENPRDPPAPWMKYCPTTRSGKVTTPTSPLRGNWRVVTIPDVHAPRQEKKAWATALGIVKDSSPNAVVIIGDFADLESISHHPKNRPDLTKLAVEYYETNLALDALQNAAPTAQFYYCEGNHEYRAVKYVNAFPHLEGLLSVPENLFILAPGTHEPIPSSTSGKRRSNRVHVDLRGITWIPFRNYLRRAWKSPWGCGYMHSAKGNGAWSGGGANHASYHANNVGPVSDCKVVVYGHHHTFQHFRTASGFEAYCAGFLGDFDANEPAFDYAGGPQPWVTGMLLQEFSGDLHLTQEIYIKNGRAIMK